MKSRFLLSFLYLLAVSVVFADTSAPVFTGNTFNYSGVDFTWDSAVEDTVYSGTGSYTQHTDTYFHLDGDGNADATVTLQGRADNAGLATVSVQGSGIGSFSGFMQGGIIQATVQTGTEYDIPYNLTTYTNRDGRNYYWTSSTSSYTTDVGAETVSFNRTDNYSSSDGYSFTVNYDSEKDYGTVSGSENGFVQIGSWSMNFNAIANSPYCGSWNFGLFGNSYSFLTSYLNSYYNSPSTQFTSAADCYSGSYGGSLIISTNSSSSQLGVFSGNDPSIGSFYGTYNQGNFTVSSVDSRSSASFAPAQIWVNDHILNWVSGSLDNSGFVTDLYSNGQAGSELTRVTVGGNLREFATNSSYNASVQINPGEMGPAATGTYNNGAFSVYSGGWDVRTWDPNRSMPVFISQNNLWVNGSQFTFSSGSSDSYGNNTDTYTNPSLGTLSLYGNSSSNVSVMLNIWGSCNYGSYNADGTYAFVMNEGYKIHTYAPIGGPQAFWINGLLYQCSSEFNNTYICSEFRMLGLSVPDPAHVLLTGTDGMSSFTGTYANGDLGFFVCTRSSTNQQVPACPANADGSLMLASADAPPGLPPAVSLGVLGILPFIGTGPDETNAAAPAAYYGNAASGPGTVLLRISTGDGAVTLCDYAAQTASTGTYSTQTHLFQTLPGQLPMPIYGVDPLHNDKAWGLPTAPAGRPSTILVGTDVWRFMGNDENGAATYLGYYSGQSLSIGRAGRDGFGSVTVTDPYGYSDTGTFYNNTFTLASRTDVRAADAQGQQVAVTGVGSLQTIASDLDILGNVLTLGSLKDDANTAGFTLSFTDDGNKTTLGSALSRPVAEWLWSRADAANPATAVPMMKLDANHALQLFSSSNPVTPGIVLDPNPNGVSHIEPQGDLDMGAFTTQPAAR